MEAEPVLSSDAYPLADNKLAAQVHNVVNQGHHYEQLRKGINESKLCF